jgi:hypothetical protein
MSEAIQVFVLSVSARVLQALQIRKKALSDAPKCIISPSQQKCAPQKLRVACLCTTLEVKNHLSYVKIQSLLTEHVFFEETLI